MRDRLNLPANAPVLGFVGRLTEDKGLPDLIDAFDLILETSRTHIFCWLAGSMHQRTRLTRNCAHDIENHPRIICTGYLENTAPCYRAMDLLILPTWREGFPNVVLEASATGIPVITTLSTGARDAVVPEVTGLLIPPGYPEAICEAVLKLLRDPELCRRMGVAARARVIEHFVNGHILGLTAAFYKSLLRPSSDDAGPEVASMDSVLP